MSDNEKIDEYELVNCVATGSATQIWEVKKSGSAQSLAMKLLLEEAFKDPEAKKALKHEATVGKSFEHPNIIQIYDLKLTKKTGYFTMEYFRAGNLKSLIRSSPAIAQARIKRLMESLAQALAYIHEKGWIHRDIKPDNVLLNKGGEVRLIDFSLTSKPSNAIMHAMTKKSKIVIQGTRTYLAPELIRREPLTPAADMYSLGVLLFEALVGAPPFRTANPNDLLMMHVRDKPATPSSIDDNITTDVDNLVMRMLAKKTKDRPGSMQELFAEVRSMKFFKEDPVEVAKARKDAAELSDAQANEDRLNSRRDAQRDRTKDGERKPAPKPEPKVLPTTEKKPVAATQQPQQPQQPPYGYPPQPGMPMPGYPGVMPGQMPPGYVMPLGMMPAQPQGMPPGMMPGMPFGQTFPGYPQMPGYPPYGVPQPGAPVPQPGAPGQQPGVFPQQGPPQPSLPSAPAPLPPAGAKPPQPAPPKVSPQVEKKAPDEIPMATFDDLEIE